MSAIRSYKVSFLWAAASTSLLNACRMYGILSCARIHKMNRYSSPMGVCVCVRVGVTRASVYKLWEVNLSSTYVVGAFGMVYQKKEGSESRNC